MATVTATRRATKAAIRKVRQAWQDTPAARLREMAATLDPPRCESWLSNALWGKGPTRLTVGDLEVLKGVIRQLGGRI